MSTNTPQHGFVRTSADMLDAMMVRATALLASFPELLYFRTAANLDVLLWEGQLTQHLQPFSRVADVCLSLVC